MWPFRKKPPPPPPPKDKRVWNEDWQIGDTAECVADPGEWNSGVKPWERPAKGARFTVIGFSEGLSTSGHLAYFLKLDGLPTSLETRGFRKVRPAAKEESEVVERILKAKPGKDKVREMTQ